MVHLGISLLPISLGSLMERRLLDSCWGVMRWLERVGRVKEYGRSDHRAAEQCEERPGVV